MANGSDSPLRHVPQWFISIFALTYVTGFLGMSRRMLK
jgi:hypothetical protein